MKYNPEIHHRRSIRLRGYDYCGRDYILLPFAQRQRMFCFGKIADGEMVLNDAGKIAFE